MTDPRGLEAIAIDAAHRGGEVLRAHFRTEAASKMETKGLLKRRHGLGDRFGIN